MGMSVCVVWTLDGSFNWYFGEGNIGTWRHTVGNYTPPPYKF